eukprot:g830.t1
MRLGWLPPSAAACAVALWAHWPATRNAFTLDDKFSILRNPVLRERTGLGFATSVVRADYWGTPLAHPASHQSFRPVTTWSFWLDLWGRPPALVARQLHTTSVVLHAVCAALVAALAWQLLERLPASTAQKASSLRSPLLASLAGALFGCHPATVEAVANVTGRAEILAGVFGVSAHILALNDRTVLAMCCGILALFSKEVGVTAVAIVLYHYVVKRMTKHRIMKATVTLACVLLLRLYFLDHMLVPSDVDNPLWASGRTKVSRWLSTMFVNARACALLMFFPLVSCPDFSGPACPQIDYIGDYRNLYTLAAAGAAAIVLFACMRILPLRGTLEIIGPLLLWFTVPATLASNLFLRVGFCFAERTYYSSVVGLSMLLCVFSNRMLQEHEREKAEKVPKKRVSRLPSILLISTFGMLLLANAVTRMRQQTTAWANNTNLWSNAVQQCEPTSRIVNNFGKVLQRRGQLGEAKIQFEKARLLDPKSALPYFNLGMIAASNRRHKEALAHYREASQRNPYLVGAFNNAGASYLALGDRVSAAKSFQRALDLNPSDRSIKANLRIALKGT